MSTPILDWPRFGRMVAAHLPDTWDVTAGTFDETIALVRPGGHRVLLETDRTGHRIVATGTFPPEAERGLRLQRHEISVRADRGPAALAAEIARRLLPAYGTDLQTAQDRLREKNEQARRRRAHVERLLSTLSGDSYVPAHENGDDRVGVTWYRQDARSSKITLHGDGATGTLELNGLPFPLVQEICALIVRHDDAANRMGTI